MNIHALNGIRNLDPRNREAADLRLISHGRRHRPFFLQKTIPGNVATTCTEDRHKQSKQALQYKPKVTTTCTEDGHKQTTKTNTTI